MSLILIHFETEVSIIRKKYQHAVYPIGFIKSIISVFKKSNENQPLIADWLFEERREILFKLLYCPRNEYEVKRFMEKIESFTKCKIMLIVL